jgi:hypothetical protein
VSDTAVDLDLKAKSAPLTLDRAAEAVWVAARQRTWSSLVVVPAEPGLGAGPLARAVAAAASTQRGETVEYLDLRGVALGASRPLADRLAEDGKPYRVVAAVACPLDDRMAQLLSSSADAAILLLEQGATALAAARRVVELVGPSRFLGAVVLSAK